MGNQNSSQSDKEGQNPLKHIQDGIKAAANKFDSEALIDKMCSPDTYFPPPKSGKRSRRYEFSDGESEGDGTYNDDDTYTDGSRTYTTDGDSTRRPRGKMDDDSLFTEYTEDYAEDGARVDTRLAQPLASSFAKRCYFTKAGIGKTTQHYEGLTLTGNSVLMLASAMKLKGCPTICDEDLRRVEQTYPNQFSRLPDELLLSSGWRRISKYCHFANKPIPDGVSFFHSKQRLHPSGGYYFLLASSVGMIRPIDVESLTKDTLVLLETDYPTQCDATPDVLISDPEQWTLVDKFCFFSGGPINTEEDVYYQADFDGKTIYMLAFLSPSLTPEELYKLEDTEPGLKSLGAVKEVEAVYDLTERDFDDLKLYHLGPCRALPQYILQPSAWSTVLPPHFMRARKEAILKAQEWQLRNGQVVEQEIDEEGAFAMGNAKSDDIIQVGAPDPEDPYPTDFGEEKKIQDGEEDFVPIKRDGYKLGNSPASPISRKLRMMEIKPQANMTGGTRETEDTSMQGSSISESASRKALIVKMAKDRIKKNEGDTLNPKPLENDPWTASAFPTETGSFEDMTLDFSGDLD